MPLVRLLRVLGLALGVLFVLAAASSAQQNALECDADRGRPLLPADPARCDELASTIRDPSGLPLGEYEELLGEFLRSFCHRDADRGWQRDKFVRDTGPYTATFDASTREWVGAYHGTHAPVVIWYSPEMIDWMETNRPAEGDDDQDETSVPDGAVIVKEMFPAPAVLCADVDPTHLLPTSGAAIMVRDTEASFDGWYWGWFGWSGWTPDWPATAGNRLAYQGFGQYCVNCHASARDNLTFSDMRNVEGQPGNPIVFLSQTFFEVEPVPSHHRLVGFASDDEGRLGAPFSIYDKAFTDALPASSLPRPTWDTVVKMPSETYDNVWVEAGGPKAASEFLTSDQCLGCHDAGGTGLQFDMTVPNPGGDAYPDQGDLLNVSPYATWRSSPMGLAGRDPIFYAQLASETDTFHPEIAPLVQDTCLGCHGILGQRQFHVDTAEGNVPSPGPGGVPGNEKDGECTPFLRRYAEATPWPSDPAKNPDVLLAKYGALARDGISCTSCHRMDVGTGTVPDTPENACVEERQDFLNPHNTGFARTFTGSFVVGPPDELYGPFGAGTTDDPAIRTKPMEHALGIEPRFDSAVQRSELCGSCHTVHLPVYQDGQPVQDDRGEPLYTYEQTTYPEWAFSAYRTGETPDGQGLLPQGAGSLAESCQSCHMPSKDRDGKPFRSKIAGIQEFSSFPEAENNLGPDEIDLPIRENFARHTLVGLNVFFLEMAQQFPDVLGIRTQDPMLVSKGLDPLLFTEQAMVDQAQNDTAIVQVGAVSRQGTTLEVPVSIESLVGHKFPSGVGFRRAFLEVAVLDAAGEVLWASGRTDSTGTLVDAAGDPIDGERWWSDDCSTRLPTAYQPHYQRITSETQVQIYQELVAAPAEENPRCGTDTNQPDGPLTTSFLSICQHVKDNRLLPHGYLPIDQRIEIARALGAGDDLAVDSGSYLGDQTDPNFGPGGDALVYAPDLGQHVDRAASVRATLYYQAIPPSYLQDRFCTSKSDDTQRLYFLAGHLNTAGTPAENWKLQVVQATKGI